ncbi:hypothetical protein C8Q79DRAFT_518486 [Trametes meyenii]|nr:hypothetical protein C8Q79DRAFT_518486 [Trametes meyenii]
MSDVLLGDKDQWLRHYTSNHIGQAEVDTLVTSLQASGEIIQDDKGCLHWNAFPVTPSQLHNQRKAGDKPGPNEKNGNDRGLADQSDIASPGEDNITSTTRENRATAAKTGGSTERQIFRPLGRIIDVIAGTPLPGLSPSCKYKMEPYDTDSEVAGSQHRIDGCLQLLESTSPPSTSPSRMSTSDVAVNFEFKLTDTVDNVCDNRWKVLYSAYHNLHSDCRRKHTYSVTIEDNKMAMWYFSRSHSAKSEAFDLLDVRAVVWALSSLVFSTVEELGYDADIRRIAEVDAENKKHLRYIYRMDDAFYKTSKCVDEYDDLIITGRATRVWEVVRVHSFDDPQPIPGAERKVLRDVWLDYGTDTESTIQQKIFRRCEDLANNFPADNDPRLSGVNEETRDELRRRLTQGTFKDLFLTIEADYRGSSSKPTAEGFIAVPDIFEAPEYWNKNATRQGADLHRASASRSNLVDHAPSVQQAADHRDYRPKQRNFVVYKEVCNALHELDDLHTVLLALYDCLLAVQILFLISWIHRDISSGNLLFHEGHGKLGDLEYAKEFNLAVGKRSSDPKTGTQIFMAVEVQSGYPIHIARKRFTPNKGLEEIVKKVKTSRSGRGVRHNFQHDLESFFWIATWLVVTRIEGHHYADVATQLFRSKADHFQLNRRQFLIDEDVFLAKLQGLRSDLPEDLCVGLYMMRATLYDAYLDRESRYDDMSTYSPLYDVFRQALKHIASVASPGKIHLVRPPPPRTTPKSGYDGHHKTARLEAKLKDREGVILSPHKVTSLKRMRDSSNVNSTMPDEEGRPEKRRPTNDLRASEIHGTE